MQLKRLSRSLEFKSMLIVLIRVSPHMKIQATVTPRFTILVTVTPLRRAASFFQETSPFARLG